jgi:multicomponent Na+:H+ antiporter subunit D
MDYSAYTTAHVVNQVQLLLLASMAFTVLMRTGLYPPELPSVNIDADVIYRRLLPRLWRTGVDGLTRLRDATAPLHHRAGRLSSGVRPLRTASSPTDLMVLWVALLLALFLLISLL